MRIQLATLVIAVAVGGCPSSSSSPAKSSGNDAGAPEADSGTQQDVADAGSARDAGPKPGSMPGTSGGTKACLLTYMGMLTGCIEYLAASDFATAEGTCTSKGGKWLAECPAGRANGCKVPPGAPGGAPGGTIRWAYMAVAACNAGETTLGPDGNEMAVAGLDPAAAVPVGPGGPVSAACKKELMTVTPLNVLYPSCAGDSVCNACITTDYAAASCKINKNFQDLITFACVAAPSSAPSCSKECGK